MKIVSVPIEGGDQTWELITVSDKFRGIKKRSFIRKHKEEWSAMCDAAIDSLYDMLHEIGRKDMCSYDPESMPAIKDILINCKRKASVDPTSKIVLMILADVSPSGDWKHAGKSGHNRD